MGYGTCEKSEDGKYVVDFYASAFFETDGDPNEYVEEHWDELVDYARRWLPDADSEIYPL